MALFDFLGFNKLPDGMRGSTLLLTDAATLSRAGEFIVALQAKFHNLALAVTDNTDPVSAYPLLQLPADLAGAAERIKKIQPQRLIILGMTSAYRPLAVAANCPIFWINARDAAIADAKCRIITTAQALAELPEAVVTGDPLAGLARLPTVSVDTEICKRFKEQREGDRWLGYFAATGEAEEDYAYALFNRAIRHKMGLMLLAPRDPARCEPVYRESIKYRLQTIRHRRLSTSFVPIKTRVYYIEDPQPLESLYACADFVIAGGTLDAQAQNDPDIVTPVLLNKPVIVGAAHRRQPLIAAAVEAGVVLAGNDSEALFARIKMLIDQPEQGAALAARAHAWLERQVGASERVLSLID
ncbi:MAG TPA: hypothetical protein VFN66_10440 [Burkholderiales bacterium]|nr:hypothetical protein [Burkholderiales bacterium]